jgi:hypothetical protein
MKDKHVRPIDAALARLRSTYTPGQGRPSEDVEEPADADFDEAAVPPAEELLWPPPGLEKIHGELPRLTRDFAVGDVILVVTLVWLGFFAASPRNAGGWGAMVALIINFALFVRAYVGLRQLMVYADFAVTRGYPQTLVWQVAADAQRDTGWMLQGKGNYTGITKSELVPIARRRVTSSVLAFFAVLWIPVTFPMIAVLGFTGVLTDAFVWLAILAPAMLMLLASVYLRYQEWSARRPFRAPEIMEREVGAQASGWAQLYGALGLRRSRAKSTTDLKLATGAAWLGAFIFLLPLAMTLVTTAIPRFMAGGFGASTPARWPRLQTLQQQRIPADSTITATHAGHALQNLHAAGVDISRFGPVLQRPTRQYPAVFENRQYPPRLNPEFWSDSLFGWIRRNALNAEQRQMVEAAARHPSAEEFRSLASAGSIDIPGTRWHLGIADTVRLFSLPFVPSRPLREVAQARIAASVLAFERGDHAAAERMLEEIVSVGFLLRDEAPTMSDAIQGISLLRMGARGLAALYDQTGKTAEAERTRATIGAVDELPIDRRGARSLEALYAYVLDDRNPRAARWETFAALQSAAPCMSLYAGIFGPTKEHRAWVERVRKALVRTPSEARFFKVIEKGITAKEREDEPRCVRVLRSFRPLLTGY